VVRPLGHRNATSVRSFFFYLGLVAAFFVLFLIAASSLPDEAAGPVDLRTYYDGNRRYFWLLVTLFQVIYVGFGFHFIAGIIDHLPGGYSSSSWCNGRCSSSCRRSSRSCGHG
jgi:hypothetical protein